MDLKRIPEKAFGVLASFGLSCTLLFLLFLITLLGTLAQVDLGLYSAKKMYFESIWIRQPVFGPFHLPLPGGYLLMAVLGLNLIAGGIVRLRRTWSRAGILITHLGIGFMLLAGFVKFYFAHEGRMAMHEGQSSAQYVSYHDWEIAISERLPDGLVREYCVPLGDGTGVPGDRELTIRHDELPFELVLARWYRNCRVARADGSNVGNGHAVGGFYLDPREPVINRDEGFEVPGAYLEVRAGGETQRGLLWGWRELQAVTVGRDVPWTFTVGERTFGATLRRERYDLPFTIRLDEFHHQLHPGMAMARAFKSDVTVVDGAVAQPLRIEMNEPMRRDGLVAYQESWGPEDAGPGNPVWSQLAIAKNPSDRWPEISCWIIAAGLLFHFGRMLARFVRSQPRTAS